MRYGALASSVREAQVPENFNKLKKTIRRHAVIKSAVFGAALALILVGALLLAVKLGDLLADASVGAVAGILAAAGIVAASLAGGLLYLIIRPVDLAVAKRLDGEFSLGERVQTMVEYAGRESAMLTLQREDAETRLSAIGPKQIKYKRIWLSVAAGVLSVALFLTGVLLPSARTSAQADSPFTPSSVQRVGLTSLIAEVQASEMESAPKQTTVSRLEWLLEQLPEDGEEMYTSELHSLVIAVIVDVDEAVDGANSYEIVSAELLKSGNAAAKKLGESIAKLNAETLPSEVSGLADGLGGSTEIGEFASALSSLTSGSDGLRTCLFAMASALSEIAQSGESPASTLDTYAAALSIAIARQYTNKSVGIRVITRLMELFGVTADELPDSVELTMPEGSSDGDREMPDDKGGGGGVGDGGLDVGSEDTIYDPDEGYVKYADVLGKYNALATELLASGNYSEEEVKLILNYYAVLFGLQSETDGE